jgi:AcrR family transcriptional regulator
LEGAPAGAQGARIRHLGADDRSSQRIRIVDATLSCLASQGLAKTTLDDIAAWAGLSRATVYRVFPGGREAILAATVETELARLFSELAVAMGEGSDLQEVLTAGIVTAARRLSDHGAIRFLEAHEPGVLLTHLCFDEMDRMLEVASSFAAPFLTRWLEPDEAARAAEWAVRITMSYLAEPGQAALEVTDADDVAGLVARFVLPGILALRLPPGESLGGPSTTTRRLRAHPAERGTDRTKPGRQRESKTTRPTARDRQQDPQGQDESR